MKGEKGGKGRRVKRRNKDGEKCENKGEREG